MKSLDHTSSGGLGKEAWVFGSNGSAFSPLLVVALQNNMTIT